MAEPKATIKEITANSIAVEFEDGSVALVPTNKNQTKEDLIATIFQFYNPIKAWDKVEDIPLSEGEEIQRAVTETDNTELDYRAARRALYPSFGDQFDAQYWADLGDDTELKNIRAKIKLVKDTVTKDKTYKQSEINELLKQ
tara:strand:- start:1151 stop:1576 length:426 start_codon:yes stop_codon:yes gene_type:complete